MSVTIRVGEDIATVNHGLWTSTNQAFQVACQTLSVDPFPRDYDPDPDLTQANRLIVLFGDGQIIDHTPPPFASDVLH